MINWKIYTAEEDCNKQNLSIKLIKDINLK